MKDEDVMADIRQKTAIVTGASGGIGRVVAQRLARDGFAIAMSYAGSRAKAEEVAAGLEAGGARTLTVQADVASAADVECLFVQTLETFGSIDVVVHAAGIMPLFPIAGADVDAFDQVIATNLRGTFLVFRQAARHVADGGRIIAFSSSVVMKSLPTYGAYIASKAGVEGLVHVLANELRGRNITVNAVAPGPTLTDLFLRGKSAERVNEFVKMSPLERMGTPEDVAGAVSFLAGCDGAWVNAQVLRVNGGFAW